MAALALSVAATSSSHARTVTGDLPLQLIADATMGMPTDRFDYESVDPTRQLVFIADLARGQIFVVDTRTNKLLSTISKVQQVHGVLAVPEKGRVYATATGVNQLVAIDEELK